MIAQPNELRALHIPAGADQDAALAEFAAAFALRSVADTDVLIDALSREAIRQWRLADATFWQRVRFRARRLRAAPVQDH
jgi:hypothetical protein